MLDYIPLTNRDRGPYCKLRTEFFSARIYKFERKKQGSVTYSTDRENDICKIFIVSLETFWRPKQTFEFRLKAYIEDNELLYKAQYGFREKFSTQHAILDIVDTIQTYCKSRYFAR